MPIAATQDFTHTYSETWMDYFDRVVTADPCFAETVANDIMEDLVAESAVMEIEGCDDLVRHAKVIQLAAALINNARQKSKHPAGTTVEEEPRSPASATPTDTSARACAICKGSGYTYPALPLCLDGLTHDAMVKRSVEVASQFRRDRDYSAIRAEFLHVSLALNQFGLLAPAFRDQPKIPYNKKEWEKHTQLLNDQIVIDLHWLHCRGERLLPRWPELKSLLQHAGEFDCDAIAQQIAKRVWTCDFRVNELITVCPRQQTQLMQLRSNEMKERFRTLLEGKSKLEDGKRTSRVKAEVSAVRMAIATWADGNHRVRGQEEIYESIWLAMRLLGSKAKPKEIANLAAFRCGAKPLDRKTVIGKVDTLRKVLDEAGIPLGV